MSDPASGLPVESELTEPAPQSSAFALLRRHDFRRLYLAIGASELGSSLHYIALMWFALDAGGPLGVVAVRLADSIPAIVFGLHGGVAADRWSRRRLMIGSDLVRGVVLIPVAIAGLAGGLPLWGLVVASFVLEAATSYFEPAYGATVPTLVDRGQRAAGERAGAGDGTGALDRRLGDRGGAPHVHARERLLRGQQRLVSHFGRTDRSHPQRARARPARSPAADS